MLIKKILILLMVLSVQSLRAQNHRETLADYLLPSFCSSSVLLKKDSIGADINRNPVNSTHSSDKSIIDYRSNVDANNQLYYSRFFSTRKRPFYGINYRIDFIINDKQEAVYKKIIKYDFNKEDINTIESEINIPSNTAFIVFPTQDSTIGFRFFNPIEQVNYLCQSTLTTAIVRGIKQKILKVQYESEGKISEEIYAKGLGLINEMRPYDNFYTLYEDTLNTRLITSWKDIPTTKLWDSIWVRMNNIRAIQDDESIPYKTRVKLTNPQKKEFVALLEYYENKLPSAKNVLQYVAFMLYYEGLEAASIVILQTDPAEIQNYVTGTEFYWDSLNNSVRYTCLMQIEENAKNALFVRPSVDALPFKEIEPFIKDLKDQWNVNWDYLLAKKCATYSYRINDSLLAVFSSKNIANRVVKVGQQFDREHKSTIPYLLDEAYNNTSKAADYLGDIPLKKLYRLKAFEALSLLTPTEAREDEAYIGYNLRQLNELLSSPADAEFAYRTSVAAGKIEFTADAQLFADRAFDWGFKNKDFLLYYSGLAFSNKDKIKLEKIVADLESQIPTMTKPELEKMIAFYTFLGNEKAVKKLKKK